MIDFHITIQESGIIWFVLWVGFWLALAIYIAGKEDDK